MSRVIKTGEIVQNLHDVSNLLDVGCRDGILRQYIPRHIEYFGADLYPVGEHVRYVGDFMTLSFNRRFDVVTAVDVLEHIDRLQAAFDKLVMLTQRHLVVSLPNCYDLKNRYKFAAKGQLGGKYKLNDDDTLDRHRWVIGAEEIIKFYQSKALRHDLRLKVHLIRYGSSNSKSVSGLLGRAASGVLPSGLVTHSVVGEFAAFAA